MSRAAQKTRTFKPIAIASGILVLLFAALPTTTIMVVGMAPTLGAFIADRTPGRYLTKCVAGMNFAGVFPLVYQLWMTQNNMATAITTVTDMYAWLVMYSAGAVGWLLFLGFPGVVSMYRALNAQRRIYVLREQQKDLINEWGESILPAIDQSRDKETEEGGADAAASAQDVKMKEAESPA